MYCTVRDEAAYLLHASSDLLEEEHVDGVQLGQVRLALDGQEVVDVLLGGHLLHDLVHVHLLQTRLRLTDCHVSVSHCSRGAHVYNIIV